MNKGDYLLPEEIECPHCGTNLELDDEERFKANFICPQCNKEITAKDFLRLLSGRKTPEEDSKTLQAAAQHIHNPAFDTMNPDEKITLLYRKVQELESKVAQIPNSNIISHKFWTRACAVFVHQLAVVLIFYAIIFFFVILFSLGR